MRPVLIALCLLACATAPAANAFRLGHAPVSVATNPADALPASSIDDEVYEGATHCSKTPRPGVARLTAWLRVHSPRGVFWGSYRCELWGKGTASLHAEGRAIDWNLDVGDSADRHEARALIELLLAPDDAGNVHALARRLGVEELIWDCSYWSSGMAEFKPYSACEDKHVDATTAHRNHVHIGLTKDGAMGRTSFWSRP